MYITVIWL